MLDFDQEEGCKMNKKGEWLAQILSQNGFSLENLAGQTGLDLSLIQKACSEEEADSEVWNIILDTVNDYPAIRTPDSDILGLLDQDIQKYGSDAECIVYYGVNQNLLGFCEYRCLDDLNMHGANVDTEFLSSLQLTLAEAKELFEKQNYTVQNASMHKE